MTIPFINFFSGIVLFILALVIRQWLRDYRPPNWRQRGYNEVVKYRALDCYRWNAWYAWRPVRTVGNRVAWLETVYRKPGNTYMDYDDWTWYYYADEFDILKETQ